MTTTHLQKERAASLSMREITPPLPYAPLRRAQRQI